MSKLMMTLEGRISHEDKYNPACIVCGTTDKLRMHAHRSRKGNMVGWVFACHKYAGKIIALCAWAAEPLPEEAKDV